MYGCILKMGGVQEGQSGTVAVLQFRGGGLGCLLFHPSNQDSCDISTVSVA